MPETKRWHLFLLSFMLLVSSHSSAKKTSCSNLLIKLFRSLWQAWNAVPSAKLLSEKLAWWNESFIKYESFINRYDHSLNVNHILNKIGPKTNPWGTPLINSSHELKDVLTLVLCLRLINSSYELKDMLTLVLCLRLER